MPQDGVHTVQRAVELLSRSTMQTSMDRLGPEPAVRLLRDLRASRATIQEVEALLERHIARRWDRDGGDPKRREIDGVGLVEVHRSRPRHNWQHEDAAKAVIESHLRATGGEVPDPWQVRDWIMEAVGPSYWRTGVLKNLGLDPNDFSTPSGPWVATVRIT
jgi:hypothetical protein